MVVDEALAPFDVLAMKTERDGYLVSKRLPDIEPLLVNRFVVRPALPEEGVHLVTMLLCAQVRQAVRSIRKRKGEQSTQSSALRPVLQRRKTHTKRSASLRMDLRIHSAREEDSRQRASFVALTTRRASLYASLSICGPFHSHDSTCNTDSSRMALRMTTELP